MTSVDKARAWLDNVGIMLSRKNAQYGDSATNPIRIFSQAGVADGLRIRIDDKLSRIYRGNGEGDEDALADLVGYIAFLATCKEDKP